jgi:hypothetical protein
LSAYPLVDNKSVGSTHQENCAALESGGNQGENGGVDETPAIERKIDEVLVAVRVNADLVQNTRKEISGAV